MVPPLLSICLGLIVSVATPHGTVVSPDGTPLPAVDVSASRTGPWTATDADGNWILSSLSAARRSDLGMRREGRWVRMDLDAPETGTLSVRDMAGRTVVPDRRLSLSAGPHRIDLGIRGTEPVVVSWKPRSGVQLALRESASKDSLYLRWAGEVWDAFPFDPTTESPRRDTLDVSPAALRLDPIWTVLATDSLPGEIGPLAQLGDTLYAASGNAIWSVPAKGGLWKREFVPGDGGGKGFLDMEVSLDTLFASRDYGADTSAWYRVPGKPWTADPWSVNRSRAGYAYRLCPWGSELYFGGSNGLVWMRRGSGLHVANTGSTGGSLQWLGVDAPGKFVFAQMDPQYWNGTRWVFPGGYGSYGRGTVWNGRAVVRKQLSSSGHWDVFVWNFSASSSVPTRFADSAEQYAMDLRSAGRTLALTRGNVSGGWDDDGFDGVQIRRPASTAWRRYPTPVGFLPYRLGAGPHRLWVGGQGRVGSLE